MNSPGQGLERNEKKSIIFVIGCERNFLFGLEIIFNHFDNV